MSQEEIDNFMAISGCDSNDLAKQFIEMANGDLNIAISLFFENGGNAQLNSGTNSRSAVDISGNGNGNEDDAQLAERLQNEAYNESANNNNNVQDDYIRPPDEARHETLTETHTFPNVTYGGIGGSFGALRNINDMFDNSRPEGIFNQRLNSYTDDNEYGLHESSSSSSQSSSDGENESDYEYVEEPVVELDEDGNITEYVKLVRKPRAFSKEERLTRLFRPPFEIMSKLTMDGARMKAQKKKKWIMINIQDNGIFQCQALNRDLWSSRDVRRLIKKNFIFLQYQYESQTAQPYLNFYNINDKENLPHIGILDPMTGERLKQWNTTVPKVNDFMNEIEKFLEDFSLDPTVTNPIVKEPTPELDPTALTEEQQMDLAIRESLGGGNPTANEDSMENEKEEQQQTQEGKELDPFVSIEPVKHVEPPNKPGITTRIQIRTGDGGRKIRRFNSMEDTVRTIYEVIKTEMEGYNTCSFILTDHQRTNLIDKLDMTIEDAGLKNSSLLLEKSGEEEEEEEGEE